MDQKKIGAFLKELRKEKGVTQEQLAEQFQVSSRTVSRWENGNNMPDLDILIEISDYYNLDLREILNGERKSENMNQEVKETVLQAVEYTNTECEKTLKCARMWSGIAMALLGGTFLIRNCSIYQDTSWVRYATDFAMGAGVGMQLMSLILSSRHGAKIRAFKKRIKAHFR